MIYLDNHATTPCDPLVIDGMLPYLKDFFGNSSSGHIFGQTAADAIEKAKWQVSELINATTKELVFTLGATESNNIAILGAARSYVRAGGSRRRIATTSIEHKSVLGPIEALKAEGWEVVLLPLQDDRSGMIDLEKASELLNEGIFMLCVQLANSEIGTIQPVRELSKLAHRTSALVHCDASQGAGKIAVDVNDLDADFLSFSAHKMYGPKGIGILWIRGGIASANLEPLMFGGGQSHSLRPGTYPVHQIVGAGISCAIAKEELDRDGTHTKKLRDRFETKLLHAIPELRINGSLTRRLPNNSNITFLGIDAESLLANIPDILASTGAACESGSIEPSRVLRSLNLSDDNAYSTLRFGFGRFNTDKEVSCAVAAITEAVEKLRGALT